eukprot:CAMPEP_0197035636 /NCGR_PEP_ID=MMETSP1384-20130603/13377_1 /TAXON_ID=29189 /ORGANISM="Ammonia sp." /LENGTH=355 /DNA_ID=CAMNT_0042465721 /DNA_START=126 /DNA_END=1193 /DNA_ORIENTATION=-
MYHEYTKRSNGQHNQIKLALRVCYLIIQIVGLYWTFIDLLRFVIDPHTLMLRNNVGCQITAYSPKLIPSVFYGCYLFQILFRLQNSFKDSFLAVRKGTFWSILILNAFFLIAAPLLILMFNERTSVCVYTWHPADSALVPLTTPLSFCGIQLGGTGNLILVVGFLWVAVMNIAFGIMFSVKLHKLMSSASVANGGTVHFKLSSLILKNSILTLIGATSTLLSYALWITNLLGVGAVFLYTDLLVNCLMIGLMFEYNEKYYKLCCKCCIVCCFRMCGTSKSDTEMARLADYISSSTQWSVTSKSPRVSVTVPMPKLRHAVSLSSAKSVESSPGPSLQITAAHSVKQTIAEDEEEIP